MGKICEACVNYALLKNHIKGSENYEINNGNDSFVEGEELGNAEHKEELVKWLTEADKESNNKK